MVRGMDRKYYDQLIGWGLVLCSIFLMACTVKGRNNTGPIFPSLVPYFGIPFVIGAMIGLCLFCLWQKSYVNLLLVIVIFIIGFQLGYLAEANARHRLPPPNPAVDKILIEQGFHGRSYDWSRHRFICGLGISSLILGGKLLKENSSL